MADIKGFYKQKKKTAGGGVTKPSSSSTRKKKSGKSATLGSGNPPQAPALIAHGSYDLDDEYGKEEMKLRQFDMDMKYGPCIGITRLDRWRRADKMGINPPREIEEILMRHAAAESGDKQKLLECLWEGRV